MSGWARLSVAVCGLAAGLGSCGCSSPSANSWGAGGGSVSQTENGSTVTYALGRLTRDDRVYFVVVANGCTGVSWGGGAGEYRGHLHARDGSTIDFSCMTPDGQSGKAVVDGHEFDLAKGALFLVSARERPARVEQVAVDGGQLQVCADAKMFPELGETDRRVATFLRSCKNGD